LRLYDAATLASRICAVVVDHPHAGNGALIRALRAQSHPPERMQVVQGDRVAEAVEQALEDEPDWLWLLSGRFLPQPGALSALVDAAETWPDRRLSLLSSVLVASDGTPLSAEAPMPQVLEPELAVEAFERHTCSLRIAPYGSLLVRGSVLRSHPPPNLRAGADLVWSARLLADHVGLLVPRSIAVAADGAKASDRLRLLTAWTRLLVSDGLPRREKPWIAFIYLERAATLIGDWARGLRPGGHRRAALSR
jgi:hypothetical protein